MIVGQKREKEIIRNVLQERRNLFLCRAKGVGKTSILKDILEEMADKHVFYSPEYASLKRTLLRFLSATSQKNYLERQSISGF